MTWRMRLDLEDDSQEQPSGWSWRSKLAVVVVGVSLWVVGLAVLAVWAAGEVTTH